MRLKNKDIAEKLGISTTAVSLALNNKPGVSEETRLKVLKLINENAANSYQDLTSKSSAKNLFLLSIHKKHGKIITDKPFFSSLLETIQQEAVSQSFSLILSHYNPGQNIDEYMDYIATLPINGMIILATEMEYEDLSYYDRISVPKVLLDASFDFTKLDSVTLDNQTSILGALSYAYQMGHREIGYLRGNISIRNFEHRFDGYMKGLRMYDLKKYNHPVISLPCSIDGAYQEMKAFLEHPPADFQLPTVFLSDLDNIALGAMQALKEAGYHIPDDISIIGYDDIIASETVEPKLTTVRVNRVDIGKLAVERLLHIIKIPENYYACTQVSSELILRDSVKKLS